MFSVVNSGDQSSLGPSIDQDVAASLGHPLPQRYKVASSQQWGRLGGDSGVGTRLARHIGELPAAGHMTSAPAQYKAFAALCRKG